MSSDEEVDGSSEHEYEFSTCTRCKGVLEIYDAQKTEDSIGTDLDDDGLMEIEWKPSDCKTVNFGVCEKCKLLLAFCLNPKCEKEPLALVGHMGFKKDETQWSRAASVNSEKNLPDNAVILDKTAPRYDVSEQGKCSVNLSDWDLSGPDGSMPHFWHCPSCDANFKFSRV